MIERSHRWFGRGVPITLNLVSLIVGTTLCIGRYTPLLRTAVLAAQTSRGTADPWTRAQTVEPGDLVKELAAASASNRPTVVCVGFPSLYRAGHVLGASFHGPASAPEGLADLTRWAQGLSRSANVVLYCGCCPLAECPNVRPAFTALRDMGFTHLRVLLLPNNFGTDWASKGYPVDRQ
jgi:hypothetical protein